MTCLSCVLVRRAAVETVSLLLRKQLQPRRKTHVASPDDGLDTEQEKAHTKIQATKLPGAEHTETSPSGFLHRR